MAQQTDSKAVGFFQGAPHWHWSTRANRTSFIAITFCMPGVDQTQEDHGFSKSAGIFMAWQARTTRSTNFNWPLPTSMVS